MNVNNMKNYDLYFFNKEIVLGSILKIQDSLQQISYLDFFIFQIHIDEDSLGGQILPSFYAEDRTNAMNQERRRENLARCLRIIRSDIEREKKGKAGVENLAKALQETPKFGNEDSQQDVLEKLQHMKSMLTYLEAAR